MFPFVIEGSMWEYVIQLDVHQETEETETIAEGR